MSNKSVAILGILAYLVSVVAGITNLDGSQGVPTYVIVISFLISSLFYIYAAFRLWVISRVLMVVFLFSEATLILIDFLQEDNSLTYGSTLVVSTNILKVIHTISYIISLRYLWINER